MVQRKKQSGWDRMLESVGDTDEAEHRGGSKKYDERRRKGRIYAISP